MNERLRATLITASLALVWLSAPTRAFATDEPISAISRPDWSNQEQAEALAASIRQERLAAAGPVVLRGVAPPVEILDDARIWLTNGFSDPLDVTVRVILATGPEIDLGTISLAPRSHQTMDLMPALLSAGSQPTVAGVEVHYVGDTDMLQAWVLRNGQAGLAEVQLESGGTTEAINHFWWGAPTGTAGWSPTLTLFNGSSSPIELGAALDCAGSNEVTASERWSLPPRSVIARSMACPETSTKGRLTLELLQGDPTGLVLSGAATDGTGRILPLSRLMPLAEKETRHELVNLSSLGLSPGADLQDLWLQDLSGQANAVSVELRDRDGSLLATQRADLGAFTISSLDLSPTLEALAETSQIIGRLSLLCERPCAPRWVHSAGETFQEAAWQGWAKVHRSGRYPVPDLSAWDVRVTLVNLSKDTSTVVSQVTWDGGSYVLPTLQIPSEASREIDLALLPIAGSADLLGRLLPPSFEQGYLQWMVQGGGAQLLGRLEVRPRASSTWAGFNCFGCCTQTSYGDIIPGSATFSPGSSSPFQAAEFIQDCTGLSGPFTPYLPSYAISTGFNWNGSTVSASQPLTGTASFTARGESIISPIRCEANEFTIGDSGPVQTPRPRIAYAQLEINQIGIELRPAGVSGYLEVYLKNTNTGATKSLILPTLYDGGLNLTVPFGNPSSYAAGEEYTQIVATWTVFGKPFTALFPYHFKALGSYRHSQYNIPLESTCTAAPQTPVHLYAATSCAYSAGSIRDSFRIRTNRNGSGKSTNYNFIGIEFYCPGLGTPRNNKFRRDHTPAGSLMGQTGPLSDSTLAVLANHPAGLRFGDRIFLYGVGIKTITDECPGCTTDQLDNFTTNSDCQLNSDLGRFPTFKLFQ